MATSGTMTQPIDLLTPALLFSIGSTLLHSGACVINDICDIDFDSKVGMSPDDSHNGFPS